MSVTKRVAVTITVEVTVDESKFDDRFMADFRSSFYDFPNLDDHIEHLAQLHARGLYSDRDFIEGYGPAADMGIKLRIVGQMEEIE